MHLSEAFESIAGFVAPADFGRFTQHVDPVWIEEALTATGTGSVRRRRLPAEQVLWLVLGMALMRSESIERVAALLGLALPTAKGELVAKSALAKARQRLGEDPVAYLFVLTAAQWATASADAHRWRGLAVYGADGTTMRVPDSPENWKAFGGHVGNGKRGSSAYPMVRVLALMAARSHLLSALRFDGYYTSEQRLVQDLWQELPDHSVTLLDRNFLAATELIPLERSGTNRHWVTRGKSNTRLRRVKRLGPNDYLVEIDVNYHARKANPTLPRVWTVRAIKYQRRGFRPSLLLTSLVDPGVYPANEIVGLYHERWELELGYDEIKTHMLDRQEAIRSRLPVGVRQEIWGIALAYNLVRLEMERAAVEAGVAPNRISFVNALALIRNAWLVWSTPPLAPGRIPDGLLDLRRHLKLLLLPERRPERSFPRLVKIKMSSYNRKSPTGPGRK